MPVTLIIGAHGSGKSYQLWQRLRAEALGAAVLIRPNRGVPADLVTQVYQWFGAGILPHVWSFAELVERSSAGSGIHAPVVSDAVLTHVLRYFAQDKLSSTWKNLASYRSTGIELADIVRRLDEHGITAADFSLMGKNLRQRGEIILLEHLTDAWAALQHAYAVAAKQGAYLPGQCLRYLAEQQAAPGIAALYIDDFQMFNAAELTFLRALSQHRRLVITAIDDARLGLGGSLAERLRSIFPEAEEVRCSAKEPMIFSALLYEDQHLTTQHIAHYHYRDALHAGRALAATLRRDKIAPAQAMVVVRISDGQALAMADALRAAEIPVRGTFHIPFLSTLAGGKIQRLAHYCRAPTWEHFLGLIESLSGDSTDVKISPPPFPLSVLIGGWGHDTVAVGLQRLDELYQQGQVQSWQWREIDHQQKPWLTQTRDYLAYWSNLLHSDAPWAEKFTQLCLRLNISDGGNGVLMTLHQCAQVHPITGDDIDELLAQASVTVERDDGPQSLIMTDAVRGRTVPRPVVFIHDLEHGRWPAPQRGGSLLPLQERRVMAQVLARDIFDEAGRMGGEIAAFLAVVARAQHKIYLGVPCGEKIPNAWLGTMAGQLNWDIEQLRSHMADEAVPGAPLSRDDAQGAHESALFSQQPSEPSFTFTVPPQLPKNLGLSVSSLGDIFHDSFAILCDGLGLDDPLINSEIMEEGSQLHDDVLAPLCAFDPKQWPEKIIPLLDRWIEQGRDVFTQIERKRFARVVRQHMQTEAQEAGQAESRVAEEKIIVPLTIPGHETLSLKGRIDRYDVMPDKTVRIVDYKRGTLSQYDRLIKQEQDGQLLGYVLGLLARGLACSSAYYFSLKEGKRLGWGTYLTGGKYKTGLPFDLSEQLSVDMGNKIAEFAGGTAHADSEGRSARDYAPYARMDEARLGQGDDE
jgi:PD-(D/E)XK nuclease superfamily